MPVDLAIMRPLFWSPIGINSGVKGLVLAKIDLPGRAVVLHGADSVSDPFGTAV